MRLTIIALIIVAFAVAAALAAGASRWQGKTNDFRAKLEAARLPAVPASYHARETEGLPLPVRRYFRAVLRDGQPMIAGVRVSQQGRLRQGEAEDSWRPFEATQVVTTRPPAFDWDARMKMAPGIKVYVRDAYAAGAGILHASLFGLVTVAHLRGTPEMAKGELMRYLAEAAWYPTALLPSQGVRWEAVDDSTARATLVDRDTSVSIEFRFDQDGHIVTARAPSRHRAVAGRLQPTPWQGRFGAYAQRAGMRIPLEGEVEWQLPQGPMPYWRGRILEIEYEFAR